MAEGAPLTYQCVRGTDIQARFRIVAQNVPKFAEQTFYGTVLSRNDLNSVQSSVEVVWDGFDDPPEPVMVQWIEPTQYDAEKPVMGLAPLYRAKAEPKVRECRCCCCRARRGRASALLRPAARLPALQLGEIIDLPEYPDCEWHTSAHVIIGLRMVGGVPAYTVWSRECAHALGRGGAADADRRAQQGPASARRQHAAVQGSPEGRGRASGR